MCSLQWFEVNSETNILLFETSYVELFQLPCASV